MDQNKDHRCKLSTVKKWEKHFNYKLEYNLNGIEIIRLRFYLCKRFEKRIKHTTLFPMTWIKSGTMSIKKDLPASHLSNIKRQLKYSNKQQLSFVFRNYYS